LRRLATGGTSDVLLACTEGPGGFGRVVVLKVLLREFQNDERFVQMFLREAAAYARLTHPAIVRLYDFFAERERLVLVLEYVDGVALNKLHTLLRAGGQHLDDSASMFIAWRLFSALWAAHSARDSLTGEFGPVIHRDVNPSNVLIPWDGHVKIADFGMAKVSGLDRDAAAGLLKGTFGYVAPEQARGDHVTVRADVYVGCVLLWELLAGRRAIVRAGRPESDLAAAMAVPSFPALAALRPDLPRVLLDAVACGLGTNPDGRAITAEDVCNVLRTVADLDEGRRSLVETLSALRPPATEEELAVTTSHPQTVITPVTASVAEPGVASHRPVSLSGAVGQPAASVILWISAIVSAVALCTAVAVRAWPRPRVSGGHAMASPVTLSVTAPPPAAVWSAAAAAPAPPASEVPESTSGTITVPVSRVGHRVWIDDHVVGEAPGRYAVTCGAHTVRVGSQGDTRHVVVPCNGDVPVQ
jgi:serine/threonine-protein kinase